MEKYFPDMGEMFGLESAANNLWAGSFTPRGLARARHVPTVAPEYRDLILMLGNMWL